MFHDDLKIAIEVTSSSSLVVYWRSTTSTWSITSTNDLGAALVACCLSLMIMEDSQLRDGECLQKIAASKEAMAATQKEPCPTGGDPPA